MENQAKHTRGAFAWWKVTVAGIVVFTIAAILLTVFSGYRGTVRRAAKAIDQNKPAALVKVLQDPGDDTDLEDLSAQFIDEMRTQFDAAFDGKRYRVTYKITDVEKADADALSEMNDRLDAAFDGDGPTVKKMVYASVRFQAKAGKDNRFTEWRFTIGKVDGRWKILHAEGDNTLV